MSSTSKKRHFFLWKRSWRTFKSPSKSTQQQQQAIQAFTREKYRNTDRSHRRIIFQQFWRDLWALRKWYLWKRNTKYASRKTKINIILQLDQDVCFLFRYGHIRIQNINALSAVLKRNKKSLFFKKTKALLSSLTT